MSAPNYFTQYYTPIFRFRHVAGSNSPVAVWTPATSARVVLTDLVLSSQVACSARISFSTSRGTIVGEFFISGSGTIVPLCDTVIDSQQPDLQLLAETSNVSSTGGLMVTATGFEIDLK